MAMTSTEFDSNPKHRFQRPKSGLLIVSLALNLILITGIAAMISSAAVPSWITANEITAFGALLCIPALIVVWTWISLRRQRALMEAKWLERESAAMRDSLANRYDLNDDGQNQHSTV